MSGEFREPDDLASCSMALAFAPQTANGDTRSVLLACNPILVVAFVSQEQSRSTAQQALRAGPTKLLPKCTSLAHRIEKRPPSHRLGRNPVNRFGTTDDTYDHEKDGENMKNPKTNIQTKTQSRPRPKQNWPSQNKVQAKSDKTKLN